MEKTGRRGFLKGVIALLPAAAATNIVATQADAAPKPAPQTQTKIIYQPRPTSPAGELGGGQVIERVIQTFSGVTLQDLQQLKNELLQEIYRVADNTSQQGTLSLPSNYAAIALTNKIDQLSSVAISNGTITGATITNSPISGSTGSFTNLAISGSGTFESLGVTGTATSTFAGSIEVDGTGIELPDGTIITGLASLGAWTRNGSDIYYDTGNVGIGTTSPFAELSVVGDGYFTGNITATDVITASTINASSFLCETKTPGFIRKLKYFCLTLPLIETDTRRPI